MFANVVFVVEVDERSVFRVGKTGFVIDRLAKAAYITQLQVPPRPPKKTDTQWVSVFFLLKDEGLERTAPVRRLV